jgi:hypothetical protein
VQGGCGLGGFLGALIGIFLVVFTGGAALVLVGGALVGFAIGELSIGTTPSLKAYDQDETFDTSNPVNLLVTDTSYYGIVNTGDKVPVYNFLFYRPAGYSTASAYWVIADSGISSELNTFAIFHPSADPVFTGFYSSLPVPPLSTTSYTVDGNTFVRGSLVETVDSNGVLFKYYGVGL